MYITDVVWYGYTAFVVAVAVFLLVFASRVKGKGD